MSDNREGSGLLKYVKAALSDAECQNPQPSFGWVPGMGLGATAEATRWAWRGMQMEAQEAAMRALKRPAHRPRKHPYTTKDARRAFAAWNMCRHLRELFGLPNAKISNRELIRLIQLAEGDLGIPKHEQLFAASDHTNEQSLSRGKATLQIDSDWNSDVCEKALRTSPQTT